MKTFESHFLFEGGQAAENLSIILQKNSSNPKLKYRRATPTSEVLKEIQVVLQRLRSSNLIDPTEPSFVLGSSKIFAIAAGLKAMQPTEIETEQAIKKALATKKEFGDIDLDVYYKDSTTSKDIIDLFTKLNPKKYAAEASGDEVNMAVVVDGTDDIIQIDIVDMTDKEDYMKFTQFSSAADIAEGIKGVVRDVLVRSIASTSPITEEQQKLVKELITKTEPYQKFFTKFKDENPTFKVRYSLGKEGLNLVVKWYANDKQKSFTHNKIKIEKLQSFIDSEKISPTGYEKLDLIAKILGLSKGEDLKHVVSMAKNIQFFDQERKQKIWESLIKNLKTKLPTGNRTQGQISKQEALNALNYLKKYFDPIDIQEPLLEAVGMSSIPHLDQMSIPEILSFFEGEEWEPTEKADGSNVSFGIEGKNIFVKSKKGNPIFNSQDFIDLSVKFNTDIHLGFAELLKTLLQNKDKFTEWYKFIQGKLKGKDFQIFGELFSKSHMNVIAYSEDKIGTGAIYIFMVKVGNDDKKGVDITNSKLGQDIIKSFIKTFNNMNGWKLYSTKPVEINLKAENYRDKLLELINNNRDILNSRKAADKEQKQQIKQQITSLLKTLKQNLLSQIQGTESLLGAPEIEGVVVRNLKSGSLAKIVDLEGFGRARTEQWSGIDEIKNLRRQLFSDIQNLVLQNADIFVLPTKQVEKLTDALETRNKSFSNIDEVIEVLYDDAVAERPELKNNFKNTLIKLNDILKYHKIKVQEITPKADTFKAFEVTQSSKKTELETINSLLDQINQIKNEKDFYIEVIKFFIGHKGIVDLTKMFLK